MLIMTSGVLARINVLLALAGLYIASMLSLSHLLGIELPCGIGTGCDLVTQDPRSQLLGIPFAYYGLAGFAPSFRPRLLHNAGYALSLAGLLVSIGLTMFSIRSIHALCTWCIASAVTMSVLFVTHSLGSLRDPTEAKSPSVFDGFWVVFAGCAVLAALSMGVTDLHTAEAKSTYVDRATLNQLSDHDLLPDGVHVTGPKAARATVVMFGDLTCPVCREAYGDITELMQRRHDFRLAFRQLPLSFHPLARPAALISEMVGEEGRFWDFVSACYNTYPGSVDDLVAIAAKLGLDGATVRSRLNDPKDSAAAILARDAAIEQKLGLHSTPSVFILIDGYYPEPIAYRGIEEMLDHNRAVRRSNG